MHIFPNPVTYLDANIHIRNLTMYSTDLMKHRTHEMNGIQASIGVYVKEYIKVIVVL